MKAREGVVRTSSRVASFPPTVAPTEQSYFQSGAVAFVNVKGGSKIQSAPVQQSAGVMVSVQDTDGTAQSGIKVYAFDGTTYKNISGTTDANG